MLKTLFVDLMEHAAVAPGFVSKCQMVAQGETAGHAVVVPAADHTLAAGQCLHDGRLQFAVALLLPAVHDHATVAVVLTAKPGIEKLCRF
ncbi:uncharacterized protein LOC114242579 isoform X5 [Bombyx mandarina]|uniref:Uncharacterized protein n=2 Tax=Bombyx TaxID=7090 RepID=A0A8R2GAE5_BOMMO|nr:RNA-binding protein 1 isoform X5 [Bombyx mori]XP_028029592.1 uncharacterized protein LOC114242579 isoform X5 [Bombyx mandarina]